MQVGPKNINRNHSCIHKQGMKFKKKINFQINSSNDVLKV